MSAVDRKIQDVEVLRHLVVFPEHTHGLFIDLGVLF